MKLYPGNLKINNKPYSMEYGYNIDSKVKKQKFTTNPKISFRGLNILNPQMLDHIGKVGADPAVSNVVSSVGWLAIRPAITMADKNTPDDSKKYSALWQGGIALGGLGVLAAFNDKFVKLSTFLAQKFLGEDLNKNFPGDLDLAKNKSALVEAIKNAPDTAASIINGGTLEGIEVKDIDAAKELANKFDEAPTFGKILKSLNPLNLFKKHGPDNISPFKKSPGLIVHLKEEAMGGPGKMGIDGINKLLDAPERAKNILRVSGATKVIHFTVLLLALNAATMLVTRYMKPTTQFFGEKFNIGFLKNKKAESPESSEAAPDMKKKKMSSLDKGILGTMGVLTLIEGANIVGKMFNKKGKVADESIGRVAKAVNEKLHIGKAFDYITKPVSNWVKNGKLGTKEVKDVLADQANVNDKWVERNVIANLFLRLMITVPTIFTKPKKSEIPKEAGTTEINKPKEKFKVNKDALYNTVRLVNDEIMNLTLLTAADRAIVTPLSRAMAKTARVAPYNEGIKVLTDQGIKNILLVCTVMGFLNNALSHKMMKYLERFGLGKDGGEKDKPPETNSEQKYQNFRRQFMASQKLQQMQNNGLKTQLVDKIGFDNAKKVIKTMDLAMIKS